jgi:hypothetical protein
MFSGMRLLMRYGLIAALVLLGFMLSGVASWLTPLIGETGAWVLIGVVLVEIVVLLLVLRTYWAPSESQRRAMSRIREGAPPYIVLAFPALLLFSWVGYLGYLLLADVLGAPVWLAWLAWPIAGAVVIGAILLSVKGYRAWKSKGYSVWKRPQMRVKPEARISAEGYTKEWPRRPPT